MQNHIGSKKKTISCVSPSSKNGLIAILSFFELGSHEPKIIPILINYQLIKISNFDAIKIN